MESTLLQANEISCRIQQISEKGLSLLLYVTSRDGQKRLDEKYGPLGWQDKYEVIDGDLYCIISAYRPQKSNIAFYRAVFSGKRRAKERDQYRLRTVERVPGPYRGRR